ncbi:MAG: hypothetical protein ACPGXY_00460 [Alphaproteobacteria bacterium]
MIRRLFLLSLVGASLTASVDASVYVKGQLDQTSIQAVKKIACSNKDLQELLNNPGNGTKVLCDYELHITMKSFPSQVIGNDLWGGDSNKRKYRDLYVAPRIERMSKAAARVKFNIAKASLFGGKRKKHVVLELEPVFPSDLASSDRNYLRKHVLQQRPHISLMSVKASNPVEKKRAEIYLNKVNEWINHQKSCDRMKAISLSKFVGEVQHSQPFFSAKVQ